MTAAERNEHVAQPFRDIVNAASPDVRPITPRLELARWRAEEAVIVAQGTRARGGCGCAALHDVFAYVRALEEFVKARGDGS